MEVVVATVMAIVAVIALAYSFGAARGLLNGYEAARMALASAQRRMEILEAEPVGSPLLVVPSAHGPQDVQVDGRVVGRESWTVEAFDDPANGLNAGQIDLRRVTVSVRWGRGGPAETVRLTRFFPGP
jgi:hypothetical protein